MNQPLRKSQTPTSTALAVLALLMAAGAACGQTSREAGRALERDMRRSTLRESADTSGGRGLERDLRVGGTGNYRDDSFAREVAYRNAVVTGNVGGGKSFRGDVGYAAADDFRSALGSDDTFAFRRDSVSSGMFGRGLRGTESVQYQYSYTTGNNRIVLRQDGSPSNEWTSSSVPRESKNRTAAADLGIMRSTSAYTALRSLTPQIVGARKTPIGIEQTSASNLIGLRTYTVPADGSDRGLNALTASAGAGTASNSAATERVDNAFKTAYSEIENRLAARPLTPRAAETPAGERTLAPGSEKPTEKPVVPGVEPAKPAEAPVPEWKMRIDELRGGWLKNRQKAPELRDPSKAADPATGEVPTFRAARIDPEVAELIRSAGGVVSAFAVGSPGTSEAFTDHLRAGQELLAGGRYFDAEERFGRALSYRPGERIAQVGRIHAQIGAGLLLSAALNLHALLLENPEMIAVRYEGGTFPDAERVSQVVKTLRTDIEKAVNLGLSAPQDAAFLLAYIGYQTKNREMTGEGLNQLNAPATQADADLAAFLNKLWLADGPIEPDPQPVEK